MDIKWWKIPSTPHWVFLHDEWIKDFKDWYEQPQRIIELIRKHPEDNMTESLKDVLETIHWKIKQLKKEYKTIYGTSFNTRGLK